MLELSRNWHAVLANAYGEREKIRVAFQMNEPSVLTSLQHIQFHIENESDEEWACSHEVEIA